MADLVLLKARLETLAGYDWNLPAIEARFQKLIDGGIEKKLLPKEEIVLHKQEILDRVQRRGEEYCYLTRSCAKGSAAALLEEFGLGNMECIKALAPFPGLGMTGGICGPVSGGLIALGLYFSSGNIADPQDVSSYPAAWIFLKRFKDIFGSLLCPDIQEILLGKYYDPMASMKNLEDFNKARAREKCPLAPGFGARIAAEIIIESMEKKLKS
jgi:hypothetical protein